MTVDPATARHRSEHRGTLYYFCCPHCKHAFDRRPEEFLHAAAR
jgi:YHS domain-containing protein